MNWFLNHLFVNLKKLKNKRRLVAYFKLTVPPEDPYLWPNNKSKCLDFSNDYYLHMY